MKWLDKLINNRVEKKVEKHVVAIFNTRTPEQEVMFQEQLRIRALLGFAEGNDAQNWLRMHQILLDHENRLTDLETRNAK